MPEHGTFLNSNSAEGALDGGQKDRIKAFLEKQLLPEMQYRDEVYVMVVELHGG